MEKNERIVRYSAAELDEMLRRGEDLTDWAKVDAMTEEELEASIDFAEEGTFDWSSVDIDVPGPKQQLTIRLDQDVIEWFKAQGTGYQTRINAVLRGYVEAQQRGDKAVPASRR